MDHFYVHGFLSVCFPTWVGEVENTGGRLQQVGAAGGQVSRDGHDGHAVAALLGAHDAVVLRLDHAAIAAEQSRAGTGVSVRLGGGGREGGK